MEEAKARLLEVEAGKQAAEEEAKSRRLEAEAAKIAAEAAKKSAETQLALMQQLFSLMQGRQFNH